MAYIIRSEKKGEYYTGSTGDMEKRLKEHNSGKTKSASSGIPWRIVHVEEFETRREAMKKEKEIKSRGGKILKKISKNDILGGGHQI